MAKDNNTLMLVALGGLAFYFWQRSKSEQPIAISSATASASASPGGMRSRRPWRPMPPAPESTPKPIRKPMPPIRVPGQTPGIMPPIACGNTLGVPCMYVEPVIDYYTPDRTVA